MAKRREFEVKVKRNSPDMVQVEVWVRVRGQMQKAVDVIGDSIPGENVLQVNATGGEKLSLRVPSNA